MTTDFRNRPPRCPPFEPEELRRDRRIRFWFRYRLEGADFRQVERHGRPLGCFTAKPLYGRLTPEGRVDRTAGYNGRLAVIFIPAAARFPAQASLVFTRIPAHCVRGPRGTRNWPLIWRAAERAVMRAATGPRSATRRGKNAGRAG